MTSSHGHDFRMFERATLLKLLYETLPRRAEYVMTGKNISNITQSPSKVTVTCTDDSVYEGDILIGADGVGSTVRRLAFSSDKPHETPIPSDTEQEIPFESYYTCVYGVSKLDPALPRCQAIDVHDRGKNWMLFTMEDKVFWFLFHRKPKATRVSKRYSEQEMNEVAMKYQDQAMWNNENGKVTFGDVWNNRLRSNLADLEEGMLDTWFTRRVVLLGDAVHKVCGHLISNPQSVYLKEQGQS
jgi:2-polyprenyl-6-methoxyphenol hydroxylase-like FAD-dependent oxidoreductase